MSSLISAADFDGESKSPISRVDNQTLLWGVIEGEVGYCTNDWEGEREVEEVDWEN